MQTREADNPSYTAFLMPTMLNSLCLDGGDLLGLSGGRDVEVLRSGDLGGGGREEDLDVTRVTLVRVAGKSVGILDSGMLLATTVRRDITRSADQKILTFDRELGKSFAWSWGPG